MRKPVCFGMAFVLCLSLCACTYTDNGYNSTPFANQSLYSSATADNTQTSQEEKTSSVAPLHSPLYTPLYTPNQVREYFEEIVFQMEYTDGPGDTTLVQKWTNPISYRIYGNPSEKDRAVLTQLFTQLNKIVGFPGIYAAKGDEGENLSIHFLDKAAFNAEFSDFVNGEDAYGATRFWYDTDTNEIHTAIIGYRTDVDQTTRNSILLEEVVNLLGVSDTVLREDSIVYQYSNDNFSLSQVDWIILKLLYNPAVKCGMDITAFRKIFGELYY